MALSKSTKVTERLSVELRWEVYNLLNHGNFYYLPNNILSSCSGAVVGNSCQSVNGANFGQINETSDVAAGNPVIAQGGPRNMNFVVKFKF